jgi:transcriptional regulator with XRE-family HTH domain
MRTNLKNLLKKKKINRNEFAKSLNLSVGAINKYCIGASEPSLDTMVKMATYLHVSLDELILGTQMNKIDDADYIEIISILSKYTKSNH